MNVCGDCLDDPYLADFVAENADADECDYCGATSEDGIAADLYDVVGRIGRSISIEYATPDEELLIWDKEEGEYFGGTVRDGADVLSEIGFCLPNKQLQNDILSAVATEQFTERQQFVSTPSERLSTGWDMFKLTVKHSRRYTLWSARSQTSGLDDLGHVLPDSMLAEIANAIGTVGVDATIASESRIWRVRVHSESESLIEASDFTPPPLEKAIQSNRMSPAGVAMFYGSEDFETACLETISETGLGGKIVSGVQFECLKDLTLLDLTAIPVPDSFFNNAWNYEQRHASRFLRAFAADLAKPITRDDRHHIEYVPTQVFTEFIRFDSTTRDGGSYDGIKFPSSKNGRACYVIFADQNSCLPSNDSYRATEQLLHPVPESIEVNIDSLHLGEKVRELAPPPIKTPSQLLLFPPSPKGVNPDVI